MRPLLPTLLPSLNALLAALALPFAIDHPTDLTPSLLLAIFESLISARLPIPPSVRHSRTRDAKSRAMLVLLGVLECDVLRGGTPANSDHSVAASTTDDSILGGAGGVSVDGWVDEIGLGEVDPERLADGGREETIFVGELLCWLARRKGILPRTTSSHRSHPRSLYSNHHSYGTEDGDGDMADFSTSLLLRPTSSQKSPSPRPPSPSIDDPATDADFSTISHITDIPRHPFVHSPEPSLSASATTGTDLSIRARTFSSRTSPCDPIEFDEASQDTVQIYDPRQMMQDAEDDDDQPPIFRPRCIHELEDPSYIQTLSTPSSFDLPVKRISEEVEHEDPSRDQDDGADDDPYAPSTPTPRRVRLTGWIDTVDATTEFDHFAASHSQSRAFNTNAVSGSQSQSHKYPHTGELSKSYLYPRPHLGPGKPPSFPSPPSSPSPSPSPPPPTSSKHPPLHVHPSPPPSPPSPTTHSDPPFDISFSTLNNTSTPAKLRPTRRPQFQTTTTRHETRTAESRVGVDSIKNRTGESVGTTMGWPRPRPTHRDRSPSYTPSPPSFSMPGSSSGSAGALGTSTAPRTGSTGISGTKPRSGASTTTTARKKGSEPSPPLSLSRTRGKSPSPIIPAGSTATTNALLTERARLLTELAALKRVRAASGHGSGTGGGGGGGGGSSGGTVVGRRVGVGV